MRSVDIDSCRTYQDSVRRVRDGWISLLKGAKARSLVRKDQERRGHTQIWCRTDCCGRFVPFFAQMRTIDWGENLDLKKDLSADSAFSLTTTGKGIKYMRIHPPKPSFTTP